MSHSAMTKHTLLTFKTKEGRRIAICPITKMAVGTRLESEPKDFGSMFYPNVTSTALDHIPLGYDARVQVRETFGTMVSRLRVISEGLRNGQQKAIEES